MFEAAELGRKTPKDVYSAEVTKLRSELLQTHLALKETKIPVIIIISGADAAGKGQLVHRLNEWLDPRGVDTHAFGPPTDEEREKPSYWRFWQALPARGRIGILMGSWYSTPIIDRVHSQIKSSQLDTALDRIAFFEKMLADDGALIIKLWCHLSKKAQRKRLEELEEDPKTRWRVRPLDWKNYKLYDKFIKATERTIRRTDAGHAPWHLIEAVDRRYRELTAGRIVLDAIKQRIAQVEAFSGKPAPGVLQTLPITTDKKSVTILDHVGLSQRLTEKQYDEQLAKYQARLGTLAWEANAKGVSTVAVLEGWDAAGKGSAIRRVTQALDPRIYRIIPIAAPTSEERAKHYLWRFWRHLPRGGMTAIYDRSWYGRVLVERVEGFARQDEWMRAYLEINDFEEQLVESGIVVLKFWIHISKDEQLRRFKERQNIPFKQFKITDEDWRNRKKWDAYQAAVNDMVAHTSTEFAPWTLVAGNDKKFARIQILKTFCRQVEKAV